jgi:hypothetical protein
MIFVILIKAISLSVLIVKLFSLTGTGYIMTFVFILSLIRLLLADETGTAVVSFCE